MGDLLGIAVLTVVVLVCVALPLWAAWSVVALIRAHLQLARSLKGNPDTHRRG